MASPAIPGREALVGCACRSALWARQKGKVRSSGPVRVTCRRCDPSTAGVAATRCPRSSNHARLQHLPIENNRGGLHPKGGLRSHRRAASLRVLRCAGGRMQTMRPCATTDAPSGATP